MSRSMLFYVKICLCLWVATVTVGYGRYSPCSWVPNCEVIEHEERLKNQPSRAENIEYSCVITRETVCVSNTFAGPPFLGASSDL